MSLRIRASRRAIGIAVLLPARGARRRVLPAPPKNENPTGINDTGGAFMLSPPARLLPLMSQPPSTAAGPRRLPLFYHQFPIPPGSPRHPCPNPCVISRVQSEG